MEAERHGETPIGAALGSPAARALLALAAVVALGLYFHADGAFHEWRTHRDMLRQVSVYGILACGMTLVIITAGIDLSVGSVLGLVAVLFSLMTIHWGWSAWLAVPLCLAAGCACGSVSGALIARYRLQPFIVTLAMMVFARGLAKSISGGRKISTYVQHSDGSFENVPMPAVFSLIDTRVFGGNVAVVTVIFLICVASAWFLLARTRAGRYLYALGGNETAAHLSGLPLFRLKVLAYGACGFFAAVAGICQAAQETQGDPEAGAAYELTAIAIVVIGGTNLMGGRGSVLLTLLGALTIGYLEKILSLNAVGESSRLMLTGGIIVAAVLMQGRRRA
ncbi:MAG: ABC transporter permease [Candidatus Hydrogenedentes bacterium]|nr:ABC transporter permease [Candidatus Hydrogenedentota bacterium]